MSRSARNSTAMLFSCLATLMTVIGCGGPESSSGTMDETSGWLEKFRLAGDITIEKLENGQVKFETTSNEANQRFQEYLAKNAESYSVHSTSAQRSVSNPIESQVGIVKYLDDPYLQCKAENSTGTAVVFGKMFWFTTGITTYERTVTDYQTVWAAVAVPNDSSHQDSPHVDPSATGGIPIRVEKTVGSDTGSFFKSNHTCCQKRIERSCKWYGGCWNEEVTRCMSNIDLP